MASQQPPQQQQQQKQSSVILATAGYDHQIRLWDATSGTCTRMIKVNLVKKKKKNTQNS